jgi:hypothetical protein
MATARDKLVADWQRQLHAAYDLITVSPRYAWLGQMRVRLFRFLLSCYGKQPWRTTPVKRQGGEVIFDLPEAQFLHGKPAKTAGKIQSVLKSVASAHGPVAPGNCLRQPASAYVTIAAESAQTDTLAVFAALKREGIDARHVVRDGHDVVEVRGAHYYRAQWLLSCFEGQRQSRHHRRGRIPPEIASRFGLALATAPFVALFATLACAARTELAAAVYCSVSVAWVVLIISYSAWQYFIRERSAQRTQYDAHD